MNLARLEQDINSLPPEAQKEVVDFITFLKQKYRTKKSRGGKGGNCLLVSRRRSITR